eukprot:448018-Amphidinium_carterae.1
MAMRLVTWNGCCIAAVFRQPQCVSCHLALFGTLADRWDQWLVVACPLHGCVWLSLEGSFSRDPRTVYKPESQTLLAPQG